MAVNILGRELSNSGRLATLKGWMVSAAGVAMGTALSALALEALLSAYITYEDGVAARNSVVLSDSLEEARFAVAAEESLERKYRLEPSPENRQRHRQAGTDLAAALTRARSLGLPTALAEEITSAHEKYLEATNKMFAAVDSGDKALTAEIDEQVVDPVFDLLQQRTVEVANTQKEMASTSFMHLQHFQRTVLYVTPLVFAIGLAIIALLAWIVHRFRAAAEQGLLREKSIIEQNERMFRSLVQNLSDVILLCDAHGVILYESPLTRADWSSSQVSLLGRSLVELVKASDVDAVRASLEQRYDESGKPITIEVGINVSTEDVRLAEMTFAGLRDEPNMSGVVVTVRDISAQKELEKQLTKRAFYDSLTGLPNRALFNDRLQQALARSAAQRVRVAVLFLDLDNFKNINDGFGHQMGDQVLVEAAARLRACANPEQTVARLGGDEFVILIPALADPLIGDALAQRVVEQFMAPIVVGERTFSVSASVGLAISGVESVEAVNLLRDADIAMYQAKANGKGRHVVFSAAMRLDAVARIELEADLREAIANHELRVFFQPIVALATSGLVEVEALVRWQHPRRGLVSPAEFIPVAEEFRLIIPLGKWVLNEACRQVAQLHRDQPSRPPFLLSVNLSVLQLQDDGFIDDVRRALDESGLPAGQLKFEITESILMRDVETMISMLWRLKELGVQLAIDDFGTGYSSLSYLKRLPIDVLKIDRSFVKGLGSDLEASAIVRAIIAMAKSLNLSVTAEGIEEASEAGCLLDWHCDFGQGYYFARPMPILDLMQVLGRPAQGRLPRPEAGLHDCRHQ